MQVAEEMSAMILLDEIEEMSWSRETMKPPSLWHEKQMVS